MSVRTIFLGEAVIPTGETESNWIQYSDYSICIIVLSPDTLDAVTFKFESERADGTIVTLMNNADTPADIQAPPAGKAQQFNELAGYEKFRIVAGSAVAADRVFEIRAMEDLD